MYSAIKEIFYTLKYTFVIVIAFTATFDVTGQMSEDIVLEEGSMIHDTIHAIENNGFEKSNTSLQYIDSIRTASPVYHAVHNGPYDRLFFYHTLNSYNSGLYMYNVISEACFNININNPSLEARIDKPVGSCLFNPYQNHLMVSVNAPAEGGYGEIKCYDAATGYYTTSIFLPGNGYCKEMFIAPNGYLYITSDMKQNYPYKPKMFVLRALDYTILNGTDGQTINIPFPRVDFKYFTANFCFNPYNDKVYATVKPQDDMPMPYTTASGSRDSLMFGDDPQSQHNGCLLTLTSEIIAQNNSTFINPGKIICRTPLTGNADNESGYVFILSKEKFTILDCDNGSLTHNQNNYLDMTYSPFYDEIYAIRSLKITNEGFHFKIFRLGFSGTTVFPEDLLLDDLGHTGAIFMNNFDNMLYVYHKMDNKMLGELSTRLIRINPANATHTTIELGDHSFYNSYPEVLQQSQTPVINPYNNTMYIPNGAHSTVSKVGFTANEALYLKPGTWNWISFPRLDRQGNDPVPSQPLLEGIVEFPEYLQLLHMDPEDQYEIYKQYSGENWSGDLNYVQSTLGYKLETDNAGVSYLPMSGTILAPETTLPLFEGNANWTGYFLTRTQSPFDAIGSEFLDKFTSMAGQHWFCYNQASPAPTPKNSGSQWTCACNQGRIEIKYTDMIVIRPFENISNFHWQYAGQPLMDDPKEATLFYSFEEKAGYEAIFIELDTLNTPAEIGAFAGDSCIGATTVLPSDTLLLICAYTEGFEGQEISFEMLYPGKSSRPRHKDYLVTNPQTGIREKRRIVAGGNQPYHVVSFNIEPAQNPLSGSFRLQCIPNPANRQVTVSYFLARDAAVSLQLTNALGVAVMSWKPGWQSAGNYAFGFSAEALPAGYYQLGISDGTIHNTEKLLIIH